MSLATPEVDNETDVSVQPDTPWNLILHNDDVNDILYVVMTLQLVLDETEDKCMMHAKTAATTGRATVFSGKKDEASQKASELVASGINATVEKAGGQ